MHEPHSFDMRRHLQQIVTRWVRSAPDLLAGEFVPTTAASGCHDGELGQLQASGGRVTVRIVLLAEVEPRAAAAEGLRAHHRCTLADYGGNLHRELLVLPRLVAGPIVALTTRVVLVALEEAAIHDGLRGLCAPAGLTAVALGPAGAHHQSGRD